MPRLWALHSRWTLFPPAVMPFSGSSSAINRYPNAGSSAALTSASICSALNTPARGLILVFLSAKGPFLPRVKPPVTP